MLSATTAEHSVRSCDVLVVGAGPAGSSCAWALRDSGLDVLLIDRCEFPRHKTCAGWITPPVATALSLDLEDYGRTRTLQPITGFRTSILGERDVETRYDSVVSFGIRRCEFDEYLLRRCGASALEGQPVDSIERVGTEWLINGALRTQMLVGAGGTHCPVARLLFPDDDVKGLLVTAQEVEFEAPSADLEQGTVRGDTPELFFCDDLTGYAWCFRKGSFLNIGVGRVNAHDIPQQMTDFCRFLQDTGRVCTSIPDRRHGHSYRLHEGLPRPLTHDSVLLIGDAAGLAYPQSGEGIQPAIESGLLAAAVIAACTERSDFSLAALAAYEHQIERRFGPRRHPSHLPLSASWLRRAAACLLTNHWFSRHVILDRWFLHRDLAALMIVQRDTHQTRESR